MPFVVEHEETLAQFAQSVVEHPLMVIPTGPEDTGGITRDVCGERLFTTNEMLTNPLREPGRRRWQRDRGHGQIGQLPDECPTLEEEALTFG